MIIRVLVNNLFVSLAIEPDSDEEEAFSDDSEILRNKPMTKRQRAKVYQEIPEEYLELPMGKNIVKKNTQSYFVTNLFNRFW
jgi:hypothetical protein